jgi:hypothetical protein
VGEGHRSRAATTRSILLAVACIVDSEARQERGRLSVAEYFVIVPEAILERDELSSTSKLLYGLLLRLCRKSGHAKAGQRFLAMKLGTSQRSIIRATAALETASLIDCVRGQSGQCNGYRVIKSDDETTPLSEQGGDAKRCRNVTRSDDETTPEAVSKRHHNNIYKSMNESAARQPKPSKPTRKAKRPKTKSDHQSLIDHFTECWSRLIGGGSRYPFSKTKDPTAAKRILKAAEGDVARAKAIVNEYMTVNDTWLSERGRTLALLASSSQLPRFVAKVAKVSQSQDVESHGQPSEHPSILDARSKGWGAHVDANPDLWNRIIGAIETGRFPRAAILVSAWDGPLEKFLQHVQPEVGANAKLASG